jgi:N-acetylneuraminic acid mutarotase
MKISFKNTLTLIATAIAVQGTFAQSPAKEPAAILNFTDHANVPIRLRYTAYASDGQYLYLANGINYGGQSSKEMMRYNPADNTWVEMTRELAPKAKSSAAYVPALGKVFIFGGTQPNGLGSFYRAEAVDINTGKVELLKISNPIPENNLGLAVWNNKIYLYGGSEEGYGSNKVYEFDPVTLAFKHLANMPLSGEVQGTVVNGVLYTFGGFDNVHKLPGKDIYAYNIATNKWTPAGKLPENVSATTASAWGNYVFLTGNYVNPKFIGYYDTRTMQFTKIESNMKERRYAGSAAIGNRLFIFGGTATIIDPGMASVQSADMSSVFSAQQ